MHQPLNKVEVRERHLSKLANILGQKSGNVSTKHAKSMAEYFDNHMLGFALQDAERRKCAALSAAHARHLWWNAAKIGIFCRL
jgi:hypothetical protein